MIGLVSFRLHEVCLIRRSEEVCERRNIVGSHMNACVILGKKNFNNQYYIVFYENQVKQSILYKKKIQISLFIKTCNNHTKRSDNRNYRVRGVYQI